MARHENIPDIKVGRESGDGEPVTREQAAEALRIMRSEVQRAITGGPTVEVHPHVMSLYLARVERYFAGE